MDITRTEFGHYIREYLEALSLRGYSPKTIQGYAWHLRQLLLELDDKGVEHLPDVTKDFLENFQIKLTGKKLCADTVYATLVQVRSFFAFLEERHYIFTNPAADIDLPVYERKLQPVPSETEVQHLLAQPDTWTESGIRDKAIMEVAYSTAARLDELIRMDIRSLDMAQKVVRVFGKGSKERILPLGKRAMFWLERYLYDIRPVFAKRDSEALWLGSYGRRINPQTVQILFRHYSRETGINPCITPHGLRRACATHMLRRGAHPVQIQMLLGHATLSTLNKYLRVTITDMQKTFENSNPAA